MQFRGQLHVKVVPLPAFNLYGPTTMPGRPQDAAQTGEGTGGVAVLADCLPAGRPGCRLSVFIERAVLAAFCFRCQLKMAA